MSAITTNLFFFFFQAEDGIRYATVTGVQTCALPISLNKPSLILVRNSDGRWNLEKWLPPAKTIPSQNARVYGPASPVAPVNRMKKIEFDDGRINFKTGDDKLPFAFTDVSGSVEQILPGRWQLQLAAQPWRSGVSLQS